MPLVRHGDDSIYVLWLVAAPSHHADEVKSLIELEVCYFDREQGDITWFATQTNGLGSMVLTYDIGVDGPFACWGDVIQKWLPYRN